MTTLLKKTTLMIILTLVTLLVACSKYPDEFQISYNELPENNNFTGEAYIISEDFDEVTGKLEEINVIFNQLDSLVKSDADVDLPLSDEVSSHFLKYLDRARELYKELPKKAETLQLKRESTVTEKIKQIEVERKALLEKEAHFNSFSTTEMKELEKLENEADSYKKSRARANKEINNKLNEYIVKNKLPIEKIEKENYKAFRWGEKGTDSDGVCRLRRKGYYRIEGLNKLGECVYFSMDYDFNKSDKHKDFMEIIKNNINPYIEADWLLTKDSKVTKSLSKKIHKAKQKLIKSKIVAKNQTGITEIKLKRELLSTENKLKAENKKLKDIKRIPITADYLMKKEDFVPELGRLLKSSFYADIANSFKNENMISKSKSFTGTSGELPNFDGKYLFIILTIPSGFGNIDATLFTSLDQKWDEKITLSKSNSIDSSIHRRENVSEAYLVEPIVDSYLRYKKKFKEKK